jgi:hypothetical protein
LYSWLILMTVPLILVCLALMFLPCLINILQKFLQECITAISLAISGEQLKAIMFLQTLQAWQKTSLITPSQLKVVKRQMVPPLRIYTKKPKMLECRETLKQCKYGYHR